VSVASLVERYRGLSLHAKFALHIGVSITVLFAALIPAVAHFQKRAALEQARHRGLQLTRMFAYSSVQAVVAGDFLIMRHVVNSIASDPDVIYAMVLSPDGRVLLHSDVRETGRSYRDLESAGAAQADRPLVREVQHGKVPAYDFVVPIYVMDERRAVARVGISIEREMVAIVRTRNTILGAGVIALVAGVALAAWQARTVTRPVGRLVEGAREITRGNLDHRISMRGGGELGDLALAFNRMTESVQALIETSRKLGSALDIGVVMESIASYALTLAKADLAYIAPIDQESLEARVTTVLGARVPERLPKKVVITPGRGLGGSVLATGEPLATSNYLEDPRILHDPVYDQSMKDEGIVSALVVPISLRGQIVGLLMVANRVARTFTSEDVDSLARMAQQAAVAMENARLYAESAMKTARLEGLLHVSQTITSTLDPQRIVQVVLRAISDLMDGIVVRLWEVPKETRGWVALRPIEDCCLQPIGEGLIQAVVATRSPVVVDDVRRDPRGVTRELSDREGFVSFLGLPLLREDALLGILCIMTRVHHRFTKDEIDLFASFAQQAAIALENAHLYQDLKGSHEELAAAQEHLVEKTRMAAMGEMAAAVAHEIRNPLGALTNCVQMLMADSNLTKADSELLEIVQAETHRLNGIVSDFLAFGRPRPPQFEEVDLHEVIDETLVLLRRDDRCASAIVFVRAFDSSVPPARADRDQLRQVFWNIFLNAVQAMRDQGTLSIETRNADRYVEIRVRDSGPGIPADAVPRLFDPFYTTKVGGSGLGLPIVRRIVEDHGGRVTVEIEQEVGTCFVLSLALDPTSG
jgi:signal transduction histidine kinase/HAMP domain-containing protein